MELICCFRVVTDMKQLVTDWRNPSAMCSRLEVHWVWMEHLVQLIFLVWENQLSGNNANTLHAAISNAVHEHEITCTKKCRTKLLIYFETSPRVGGWGWVTSWRLELGMDKCGPLTLVCIYSVLFGTYLFLIQVMSCHIESFADPSIHNNCSFSERSMYTDSIIHNEMRTEYADIPVERFAGGYHQTRHTQRKMYSSIIWWK